ncbi:glycosyltransferase family 4 protein [Colwelliaceae bacterium BS250]
MIKDSKKILFVVNDDWFFISHRLPIAIKARELGYDVHIATGSYQGESKLKSYGFSHHTFSIARAKVNPFSDLNTIFSLYCLYRKLAPDLVHHITIKPVIFGGIAARLARIPAVVSAISGLGVIFIQEGVVAKIKKMIVGNLYRLALGSKNSITITQNKDDKEIIQRLARLPNSKMRLIKGSGVDLDKFSFSEIPNHSNCKVILLARMLKDKGVVEFYNAAIILKRDYSNVEFILAGDVHDNPASLTQIELDNWNTGGVIKWIGHQDNPIETIKSADIVVLPSYREGLPKVLLEAAAIGRPIVTTDVPGCRDAVLADETALLVPVKESEPLAFAIKQLLDSSEKRATFGRNARAFMEKEFSIDSVVEKHIKIFEELI